MNNEIPMRAEDRFVDRLRALLPPADAVLLGVGDDAAILRGNPADAVATTDLLVEGIDFLPGEDPERLGRRAVSVSLSDIAAMGARPRWFLLSIALPSPLGEDFALALCRGAWVRGREHGAALAGGDLSRGPCVFVSVAMGGQLESAPLKRSGAQAGDLLYVSGATGRAAAGLALALEAGRDKGLSESHANELLAAYRDPEPRVALGLVLGTQRLARAAIDVSDGLGADATRLARASGVRAVLERNRLPLAPALAAFAESRGVDPLPLILGGGDDYEILFAAPESAAKQLAALPSEVPISRIGFFEAGSGAVLRDDSGDREIDNLGHDHLEAAR
jgi:thiamine-monophosphate kinase